MAIKFDPSGYQDPLDPAFAGDATAQLQKFAGLYPQLTQENWDAGLGQWLKTNPLGSGSNPYAFARGVTELALPSGGYSAYGVPDDPSQDASWRQIAEARSPEGIARANKGSGLGDFIGPALAIGGLALGIPAGLEALGMGGAAATGAGALDAAAGVMGLESAGEVAAAGAAGTLEAGAGLGSLAAADAGAAGGALDWSTIPSVEGSGSAGYGATADSSLPGILNDGGTSTTIGNGLDTIPSATLPRSVGTDFSGTGLDVSTQTIGEGSSAANASGANAAGNEIDAAFSQGAGANEANAAFDAFNGAPASSVVDQAANAANAANGIMNRNTIKGALDALAKYGPLALSAGNLMGQKKLSQKYSTQMGNVGQTQRGVANQQIAQAQSGQINPNDQYAIDQWKRQATAKAKQYYANAGLSDSSMAVNAINEIEAKATAMHDQARQDLLQAGINTLNMTDKYQQAAVGAEMQADQNAGQLNAQFLNTYGQWMRMLPQLTGNGSTQTTSPATASATQ